MKNLSLASVALVSIMGLSHDASADESSGVSANIGVVSQYHFRGIQQTSGASASAGLDYETGNFSIGTWAADVEDGLEIDVYGAYGWELSKTTSFSVGFSTYQYTGDFDSAYNELNLSASFGNLGVGYNHGKWDGEVGNESATEGNYSVLEVSYTINSFTGTLGIYGDDSDGEYFDLNYATEIGDFDVGVGLLMSGSDLNDDESMYFSFSKSIDL